MHNSFSLEHSLKLSATSAFTVLCGERPARASCWESLQWFSACGFCLVYVAFLSVVVLVFSLGSNECLNSFYATLRPKWSAPCKKDCGLEFTITSTSTFTFTFTFTSIEI